MQAKNKAVILCSALLLLAGCSKYTDIQTQGSLIPGQLENYRYLLNNTSTFEPGGILPDIASADVNIADSVQQAALSGSSYYHYFRACYTWQSPIYELPTDRDRDWDTYYARIYNCNVVLDEVPGSSGSDAEKTALMAEALTHRADAYLNLVNEYAKPYNMATAAADPGVPLLLAPSLDQPLNRASVAVVYDRIAADLTTAVRSLPEHSEYNTLPGKAAAYSLLARMYLLMADYPAAGLYADSALALQSTLNDLGAITTYPHRQEDPEIIFGKIAYTDARYPPGTFRLSDELLALLGTADMRYQLFTADAAAYLGSGYTGRFFYRERLTGEARNIGTSVPEMMLVKAESLARAGDAPAAMEMVNRLRQQRFKAEDYVPLAALDANDAIVKVVEERRREFFCRMLPWFDQRRLKNDPLFSRTYTRTWHGDSYTLEPNSNRYVFPIGMYYINLNPEIEQNP
ncbi:RagB/SusD family nutrient uptake outer membrane protein [Chitinophaga japonensis]|uniref:SusD-like starch-binding protein associating with outer membrane n=1 Tax=Chitinophaga japonensis TaxID=104662 RepID=A0A562T6I9_CHIJA|nr:RagB/SusD family nutrient uptake outer membrane protein [Chitinophaga japonensis]TWI88973.1 SusD-like starch-binding protein associating with outer membrane [Chitinophaga japonensis]